MRKISAALFIVMVAGLVSVAGSVGPASATTAFPGSCSSSVSGDFNGDGISDLAVGVPGESSGAGAVNVIYGSLTLGGLNPAGATVDVLLAQGSNGVDDIAEAGDGFGSCVAAGDFNGDEFSDLAVGVPGEDIGSKTNMGAVNVIYGKSTGLQTTSPLDQFWTQDSSGIEGIGESDDNFGQVLASGDFNADGNDDLAIGVPNEDTGNPAQVNCGAVNVIYGSSASKLSASAGRADQVFVQGYAGLLGVAESDDVLGSALGVGDFNGDGADDLAMGAPTEDDGSVVDAGAVNVVYGSDPGGLALTGDQLWTQNSKSVLGVAETNDQFGRSLAGGNFKSLSVDDLLIGAPFEDVGAVDGAGVAQLLPGATSKLSGVGDVMYQEDDPFAGTVTASNNFGASVAMAADLGADDKADILIGTPGYLTSTGRVYQLTSGAAASTIAQITAATGNKFGASITTGDYDGDELSDIVIGAPGTTVSTFAGAGEVDVRYTGATVDKAINQDSSDVEGIAAVSDGFGSAVG